MRTKRLTRFVLLTMMALMLPSLSHAGIILSIGIAPPPLPVYDQPLCPGDGYIWTPGYWAYDDVDGYFWVPGTWVEAPTVGFLWTPGYWGWGDGVYVFHEGYWGPHVGFYGGIDYGFGYTGGGYEGGYWRSGAFYYNTSVNRVENVRNVYNKTVVNVTVNHVSYNGGSGGVTARPTAQQESFAREHHTPATSVQTAHVRAASGNRQLFESQNHGKPAIAATARPNEFSGRNVVAAKAAAPSYKPAAARNVSKAPENRPGSAARPNNESRPASRESTPARSATPAARENTRPQPVEHARQENIKPSKPVTQSRPVTQPRTEQQDRQRLATQRPAERPQAQQHAEPRREAPAPERRAPEQHAAQRPPTQEHAAPRPSEPRPQAHPAPAPRQESRPQPPKEREKK